MAVLMPVRFLTGCRLITPVLVFMTVHGNQNTVVIGTKNMAPHGCVNNPPDFMAKLYAAVDEGTPVIVYKIDSLDP